MHFTDRYKEVMNLAKLEAYNQKSGYIGTEHILLGFLKEGSGVGANVLRYEGVDLSNLRQELESLISTEEDSVIMEHTPRAKKVIRYAFEASQQMNLNYIGTESLLVGMIKETGGIAAQVLMNRGLTKDGVVKRIEKVLGISSDSAVQEPTKVSQYWKFPRANMPLDKFLELCGYNITPNKSWPKPNLRILKKDSSQQACAYFDVGRIDLQDRPSNEIDSVNIYYEASDKEQMQHALDLRDILDNNKIKYCEVPNSSKVLEILKTPQKDVAVLIGRLEEKIKS